MLYEGGELDAHLVSLAQMTNSSTTVQLRNDAPLLYSICWQQLILNQMGFLTNLISATVKTALTPVAIVKDVVDVATGNEPENTKKLLKSAAKDAEKAGDTMMGENNDGLL